MLEARRIILTTGAEQPSAWRGWDRNDVMAKDIGWETFTAAAQQLQDEGLVTAKPSMGSVAVRITNEGVAAVRRGAF